METLTEKVRADLACAGERAAAVELALEWLFLAQKISKDADDDAPIPVRVRVECAMALVDLVRSGNVDRLKTCAADDCDRVLVDLSKNRSRRFCTEGNCGNRTHVAAYRERRATSSGMRRDES